MPTAERHAQRSCADGERSVGGGSGSWWGQGDDGWWGCWRGGFFGEEVDAWRCEFISESDLEKDQSEERTEGGESDWVAFVREWRGSSIGGA